MIRVLVADDQALVRGTICLLIDTAPDLEVIGAQLVMAAYESGLVQPG